MANDTLTGELEPITMASTKKQMLAAYNELFEKLEEKREAELKPEERIVERQAEEVLGVAESLSLEGIGREVGNLRSEIGATLVALSDKLEEAVGKYVQTTRAVQVREKQLAEIYDIEKAASSLTALLEAQKQKRDEFDAERARRREESEVELAERRDELEAEIASMQEEWDREKALHAASPRSAMRPRRRSANGTRRSTSTPSSARSACSRRSSSTRRPSSNAKRNFSASNWKAT